MSGAVNSVGEFFGLRPKKVKVPKAPTIDDAAKNRDEFDRIRRRRGVLANIFNKNASDSPSVGVATLGE